MEYKYKDFSEITPYENNPRNNEPAIEAVAHSLQEFGWRQPVVVDKDGVIVAGHTRWLAAQRLLEKTGEEKWRMIPVHETTDLTEEQAAAYRLADNKTNELAVWDEMKLEGELAKIAESEIDMSLFGFDSAALDELFADTSEVVEDDYEEQLHEEPKSKLGDIYQLGRHRLMCGDSTNVEDIKKLVDGAVIDLWITDPPYNVEYVGKTKDALTIKNDSMDDSSFRQFLRDAYTAADAVMKPGAVFYIWHADSEGYNFQGACRDVEWKVRECLVWVKNSMVLGWQDYQYRHESCLFGWKSGASHLWNSDRKQTTVLEFKRPTRADIHPTMKPIALFDYQIKNSSKPGENVLDSFNGSGTTIMACEQNGRNAFAIELDPRYVDATVARWEQFTGKKATKLN